METGIPEGDFHLSDVIRLRTHDGPDEPGQDGVRTAQVTGQGRWY
jgi:hypothetical protein